MPAEPHRTTPQQTSLFCVNAGHGRAELDVFTNTAICGRTRRDSNSVTPS